LTPDPHPEAQQASRPADHAYAVVACSRCGQPWAVELRHDRSTCPSCRTSYPLAGRTHLWEGNDGREAQAAVAQHRAVFAGGQQAVQQIQARHREPRHDTPGDAAAAQAAGITNLSARAEAVALWMTRLAGPVPHDLLIDAMGKAGIPAGRAEREVVRLLATEVMVEPKAGSYRVLES